MTNLKISLNNFVQQKLQEADYSYIDGHPMNINWEEQLKHYYSIDIKPEADDIAFEQIKLWCKKFIGPDHFTGIWIGAKYIRFWFEKESDCLLFKLKWAEMCQL